MLVPVSYRSTTLTARLLAILLTYFKIVLNAFLSALNVNVVRICLAAVIVLPCCPARLKIIYFHIAYVYVLADHCSFSSK